MTFKNLINNFTSHLMSMLCKSSTSKYMIMIRNFIYEIMKIMIKLIIKIFFTKFGDQNSILPKKLSLAMCGFVTSIYLKVEV